MNPNPYSPPQSGIAAAVPAAVVARPVSVWLLFLLLLVLTALSVLGTARFIWFFADNADKVQDPAGLAMAAALRVAVVLAFVAASHGVFRRRNWARWVGLLGLCALAVLSAFVPDTTDYASEAERRGGQLARFVVIPLLFIWWAYAYGFSAKARRYFSR